MKILANVHDQCMTFPLPVPFTERCLGLRRVAQATRGWISISLDISGSYMSTLRHLSGKGPYHLGDGYEVPIPHLAACLPWDQWETFAQRIEHQEHHSLSNRTYASTRQVGEQATMFLRDPCGNALEFKGFKDIEQLFARSTTIEGCQRCHDSIAWG